MRRSWAIAAIALWIVVTVVMNYALAAHAAPAPTIPMDRLSDVFV